MDQLFQFRLILADEAIVNNPYEKAALLSKLAEHLKRQTYKGQKPRRVGVTGCAQTPKVFFAFSKDVIPPYDVEVLNQGIRQQIENIELKGYVLKWDETDKNVIVVYKHL